MARQRPQNLSGVILSLAYPLAAALGQLDVRDSGMIEVTKLDHTVDRV